MARLLLLSFIALLAVPPAIAADLEFLTKLDVQALSPVVQVNRNCSGSIIYSDRDEKTGNVETLVLTAKHCIEKANSIGHTIYLPSYQVGRLVKEDAYKAKVQAQDYAADLALLVLSDTQTLIPRVAKLAPGKAIFMAGEDVYAVGYSRGLTRTVTKGMLSSMESVPFPNPSKDNEYLRATSQIAGGNSGGALFHINETGEFEQLGVATAVIPASDFMGYWTAFGDVETFLKRAAPQIYGDPKAKAAGEGASVASVQP